MVVCVRGINCLALVDNLDNNLAPLFYILESLPAKLVLISQIHRAYIWQIPNTVKLKVTEPYDTTPQCSSFHRSLGIVSRRFLGLICLYCWDYY